MSIEDVDLDSKDYTIDSIPPEETQKACSRPASLGEDQYDQADVVFWDGPTDRTNPQNWSPGKKGLNVVMVSVMGYVQIDG